MKKFKRSLSLIMAWILMASFLPLGALYAQAEDGDIQIGSSESIKWDEFFKLDSAQTRGKTYTLLRNLDITADQAMESFAGKFNGNGYSINIQNGENSFVGLFGKLLSGASVENLTVNADITSEINSDKNAVGLIAGVAERGTKITKIKATGSVTLNGDWAKNEGENGAPSLAVGGIVGAVTDVGTGSVSIRECLSEMKLKSELSYKNCENRSYAVGGIVGSTAGGFLIEISDCLVRGSIESKSLQLMKQTGAERNFYQYTSGILGMAASEKSQLQIIRCMADTAITSNANKHDSAGSATANILAGVAAIAANTGVRTGGDSNIITKSCWDIMKFDDKQTKGHFLESYQGDNTNGIKKDGTTSELSYDKISADQIGPLWTGEGEKTTLSWCNRPSPVIAVNDSGADKAVMLQFKGKDIIEEQGYEAEYQLSYFVNDAAKYPEKAVLSAWEGSLREVQVTCMNSPKVGETTQCVATAKGKNLKVKDLSVQWSVTPAEKASVTENGLLTLNEDAVAGEQITVSATVSIVGTDSGSMTGSYSFSVPDSDIPDQWQELEVEKLPQQMAPGESVSLSANAKSNWNMTVLQDEVIWSVEGQASPETKVEGNHLTIGVQESAVEIKIVAEYTAENGNVAEGSQIVSITAAQEVPVPDASASESDSSAESHAQPYTAVLADFVTSGEDQEDIKVINEELSEYTMKLMPRPDQQFNYYYRRVGEDESVNGSNIPSLILGKDGVPADGVSLYDDVAGIPVIAEEQYLVCAKKTSAASVQEKTVLFTVRENTDTLMPVVKGRASESSTLVECDKEVYKGPFLLGDKLPMNVDLNAGPVTIKARFTKIDGKTVTMAPESVYTLYIGDKVAKPVIKPDDPDQEIDADEGITIHYPVLDSNIEIYYTNDGSTPTLVDSGAPAGTTTKYTGKINFPEELTYFQIQAIAVLTADANRKPSDVAIMTYLQKNKTRPKMPTMLDSEGKEVDEKKYYEPNENFTFAFHEDPSLGNEKNPIIRYSMNGAAPSSSMGTMFKPVSSPFSAELSIGQDNTVTVRAVYCVDNFDCSDVKTYKLHFIGKLSAPKPSLVSSSGEVASGIALKLSLAESDIPINMRESGSGENKGVHLAPGEKYEIPKILYAIGASKPGEATKWTTYTPAHPKIFYDKGIEGTGVMPLPATEGESILLKGNPGDQLIIRTMAESNDTTQTKNSEEKSYTYIIRQNASAPTAYPVQESIEANSTITLNCSSPDTAIFYTLFGSVPKIYFDDNGRPMPQDVNTLMYEGPILVEKNTNMYLTINAIAVSKNDTLGQSEMKQFNYQIKDLKEAPAPLAVRPTDSANPTELKRGESIKLTTDALNSNIYYTVDGTLPSVEEYQQWQNDPARPKPSTQIYDNEKGILMSPEEGRMLFTVTALTHEKSVPAKFGDSKSVQFVYQIGKAAKPSALPDTTNGNNTVLAPMAKVQLLSSTLNAKIYYTIDNSVPNPDAYEAYAAKKTGIPPATLLYSEETGVLMRPINGNRLFTITAVARESSVADSDLSYYTYQIMQADAPAAFPATSETQVATVSAGSKITLTSQTPNVDIYYTTDNTTPVKGAANCKLYDPAQGILMPEGESAFFTIIAFTSSKDPNGYANSNPVRFTYQLPAPVQAVYATPAEGTVVKGASVSLVCSTEGAKIFYEAATDGSTTKDPVPYKSQPYDTKTPIVLNKDTRIKAIAEKDGVKSKITEYYYVIADQLKTPTPSIAGGSVVAKGSKVRFTVSSGAMLVYTKDGSDPALANNKNALYGTDIIIDGEEGKSITIRAYATQAGKTPSEIATVTYSIAKQDSVVMANPEPGSVVRNGTKISLSTAVSGASIYYTTNGDTPTTSSKKGTGVTLGGAPGSLITLKALATNGSDGAAAVVFTYTLMEQTAAPTASIPTGAIIMKGAQVALTVKEGSIYYTTDGTGPTTSSILYSKPIELEESTVLKAIAVADNKEASPIVEYIYTKAGQVAAPSPSLTGGELELGTKISLSCATEGAEIYYSTNGVDPTEDNLKEISLYSEPISITRPVTIKMIASKKGQHISPVNLATYTVVEPEIPTLEPPPIEPPRITSTDRLISRRTYSNEANGPSFTGALLQDSQHNMIVSAQRDILPSGASLKVEAINTSSEDVRAVNRELGYEIVSMYDVSLISEGTAVQPSGEVEIGMPIPSDYQNGIVVICRLNDDGTLNAFTTRRAGGMAYVMVDHFSKYAITAPPKQAVSENKMGVWIACIAGAAALATAAVTLIIFRKNKRGADKAEEQNTANRKGE